MKAKRKPLEEIDIESLGIPLGSKVNTLKVESPPDRQEGVKVETVDQLVDKLKNEAKVI
jgi:electron transfer flavoprotein beta subunit